ncbi:MAG: N-formylglutamate amidohydrolase [Paracoccaceae bacterium]
MTMSPYQVTMPKTRTTSVVFAAPHSGRNYPASFLERSVLDAHTIRSSEDAFVDVLFNAAPRFGAPLLTATAPRAYVDLNRGCDELDPALIRNMRLSAVSPRVSSGLGVIPRVVANGRSIYSGKLSRKEVDSRLRNVWHPYHSKIQELLTESMVLFDEAVLVDCHSMPHEAIESIGTAAGALPEVVLGDRFGAAADSELVDRLEAAFTSAGLKVARNAPFAGAYTAQFYGRPSRGQHVVQVEIDRSLYMDEATIRPNDNFDELKAVITRIIAEITIAGRQEMPLAAE